MKKIGLLICSLVLFLGFTNADIIPDDSHYVDKCVKLANTEIDNYKVVIQITPPAQLETYEPKENECLRQHYHFGDSIVYLINKENENYSIDENTISLGTIDVNGGYYRNGINEGISLITETYWIVNNNGGYKLEILNTENQEASIKDEIENSNVESVLKNFGIARIWTILIETLILFLLAKLFWRKEEISNIRLIIIGILASSITLPFLWFILPYLITNKIYYTIFGELLITAIEIVILKYGLKISRKKAILASITCNLCSYLFGSFVL